MFAEINRVLEREAVADQIKQLLQSFHKERDNITFKKGIYIYGASGCGKTFFVTELLKELNYDIIRYDAGDIRNKSLIETITHNNISSYNVLQQMKGQPKKIAILMDEIDGMNNGDKGGITSLIKLIRQKKTKKQKLENKTMNPIICVGNHYMDKKIKELMKVSNVFELKTPTEEQITTLYCSYFGTFYCGDNTRSSPPPSPPSPSKEVLDYINGDLRKLEFICKTSQKFPHIITGENLQTVFNSKNYNEDIKHITKTLFSEVRELKEHTFFMNDTERTIVALLWHENVIDVIDFMGADKVGLYSTILRNICFADYMDRITFQNQIWEFNEMTSLIKTFHNNKLFHDAVREHGKVVPSCVDIRFTKVLTKYSTEYNNQLFIINLCQELDMDKKDMFSMFQEFLLKNNIGSGGAAATTTAIAKVTTNNEFIADIAMTLEKYNIHKLDIKRMYKYLDKNIKKDAAVEDDDFSDDADESFVGGDEI